MLVSLRLTSLWGGVGPRVGVVALGEFELGILEVSIILLSKRKLLPFFVLINLVFWAWLRLRSEVRIWNMSNSFPSIGRVLTVWH